MNRFHALALLTGTLLGGAAVLSSPVAAASFPEPRIEATAHADQTPALDYVGYRGRDRGRDDDDDVRRDRDDDDDDDRDRRRRRDRYDDDRYDTYRDRGRRRDRDDRDFRVPGSIFLPPPARVVRRCFPARPYFTVDGWRCRGRSY